jgi:aryl-alcohol dehydrogenase-like predicted oxidoreductase
MCEQPPYSILVRGIEAHVLPVCERYGMGVITWSPLAEGWLTGRYRKGAPLPPSSRSGRHPVHWDMSIPENEAKLEAAEALAVLAEQEGVSLIHLAIAFALEHPAVSSAIIGPRTIEQLESQLGAEELQLSDAVLDRIDEIVPPGRNVSHAGAGYDPPSLTDPAQRRRRRA